jgi:purine-binding chemotaxis protein CheW
MDMPSAESGGDSRFGVFFLASMQLALALDALREVVPCGALATLPCAAPCVVGGVDLRGVLVPVVDLRRILGLSCEDRVDDAPRSIVIMEHQGFLLGLLAHGVVGVFDCPPGRWNRMAARNAVVSILGGSFQRGDDATLVSVLSPEGLAGLQGVPMVVDPSPTRQAGRRDVVANDLPAESYLMLVRSGKVPMALASEKVYTTILHPRIQPSPLTGAYCLGIIEYAGVKVPAVDVLALCGLGGIADLSLTQAFLIQYPKGWVAFIVDEVIDVVRADGSTAVPIPARTLPQTEFFAGVLPLDTLPPHTRKAETAGVDYYLLLDGALLATFPQFEGLARMNTLVDGHSGPATPNALVGEVRAQAERCQVLTYDLGFEVATPIDQIAEIIPWAEEAAIFGAGSRASGLVVSRGRAIPTFSLSGLIGLPGGERSPTASVLVVEVEGGDRVGFTVSRLVSIDEAPRKRPESPGAGRLALPEIAAVSGARWSSAMVGSGSLERMLGVLDLQHLAHTLCEPAVLTAS